MPRLLIRELMDTLANPDGMFRSLKAVEPLCDLRGEPIFVSGNASVVFKISCEGQTCALKFYTDHLDNLVERYSFVAAQRSPIACRFNFLPDEVMVFSHNRFCFTDVVLMPWLQGQTLDFAIRSAVHKGDCGSFERLASAFDLFAARLLSEQWAHGDLKPENIVVAADGQMSLVDFDSLYAPCLDSRGAVGTPLYSHPKRTAADYSKLLDGYGIALLALMLHALAADPSLCKEVSADGVLFQPDAVLCGNDHSFVRVAELFAHDERMTGLCSVLTLPLPLTDVRHLFPNRE